MAVSAISNFSVANEKSLMNWFRRKKTEHAYNTGCKQFIGDAGCGFDSYHCLSFSMYLTVTW